MWRIAPGLCMVLLATACDAGVYGASADAGPSVREAPAIRLAQAPPTARAPSAQLLLPASPELRATAQVTRTQGGYTARARHAGVSVQITGAAAPGRAGPLLVQRTEYGLDASFGRAGGVYSVTLTCDEPTDRRCADEAYIRELTAGLTGG